MEAWRPIERQQRIYDHFWGCAVEAFPDRSHASLRRSVCRFVAPTNQKAPPGHCTGGAVDVCLVRDDDEPYDTTAPFTRMQGAPTYAYGLSEEASRNRMILVDAMLSAGFSNCRDEWWHYSYGDAGWAVRFCLSECPYGLARLDEALYGEQELEHIEAMKSRPNPFKG
jgi:D-alanyl-D-alanine dipeptidase